MPSRLRYQQNLEPITTGTVRPSFTQPPQKKQKMSLTQTYYIASSARAKLGKEACRPDHNLRLLVGHANLLDSLMLELQDAEREQEAWFNQSVQKAQKAEEPRHIQWADTIVEEEGEEDDDEEADESDSDSDFDEEDFQMLSQIRSIRQAPVQVLTQEFEDDEEEYYDEEEDEPELALVRTQSHSANPPELVDDSDSEDDSPPSSPPQPNFEINLFDEKQAASISEGALIDDTFYIRERNAPLIAAY
jgi:hypothetical protein